MAVKYLTAIWQPFNQLQALFVQLQRQLSMVVRQVFECVASDGLSLWSQVSNTDKDQHVFYVLVAHCRLFDFQNATNKLLYAFFGVQQHFCQLECFVELQKWHFINILLK